MSQARFAIRPGERRDTWAAFFMLFGFIGSHSVLETARDALFLAKVPASRLPWMYLAIAVVSLATAQAQARFPGLKGRRALSVWSAVAGGITGAFWLLLPVLGAVGVYALYVWSGVLTTLVLVHFWTLLGDIFSVTQAKRLYGVVGAGSSLGAIAGSGAASALARVVAPSWLLAIAAAGFGVAAALPWLFHDATSAASSAPNATGPSAGRPAASLLDNARFVARQPYARRVALLMTVSAACLTVADYVFKSTVARTVPPEQLGAYLGGVYFILNVISLTAQVALVGWLIRRFDLSRALALLPALLFVGGVGMIAAAGLAAALVIKGADGALRYSLHRTSTELLFVPLSEEARRRVKAFIEVVGQRGGQSMASIAILAAAAFEASPRALAMLLVALAAVWAAGAIDLRRHYLDLFRRQLKEGRLVHLEDFPELDVASLETLIASLDSPNDSEVLAALDVLERERRVRLVPALILYHPSDEVVERALSLFTRAKRTNVVPVADRLLESGSPRVRAAAIAARSVLRPDPRLLNLRLGMEDSPEVRATIIVNLIASGEIVGAEAKERVDELLARGSVATRVALADAIARREARSFTQVLVALSAAPEAEVRLAAVQAMRATRASDLLPALLGLLEEERTRPVARSVLVEFGEEGMACVEAAFSDGELPMRHRWELPKTLGLFEPAKAAPALLRQLTRERDGMVRYRLLRALEGLARRNPGIRLDHAALDEVIEATVSRAYRYLDRRVILSTGAAAVPRRKTPGHDLLLRMLHDKETNAVERLFRLLGLRYPREDFAQIHRGLKSTHKPTRASSVELCESTLAGPLRTAVLGLVDDVPDAERLGASGRYHEPLGLDYDGLLDHMLGSTSDSVQDLTVFHIGELGLSAFEARIAELPATEPRADVARALELLGGVAHRQDAQPC